MNPSGCGEPSASVDVVIARAVRAKIKEQYVRSI